MTACVDDNKGLLCPERWLQRRRRERRGISFLATSLLVMAGWLCPCTGSPSPRRQPSRDGLSPSPGGPRSSLCLHSSWWAELPALASSREWLPPWRQRPAPPRPLQRVSLLTLFSHPLCVCACPCHHPQGDHGYFLLRGLQLPLNWLLLPSLFYTILQSTSI